MKISERARAVGRVSSKELNDNIARLRADGKDVLSLHGSPNWLPPEHVLEAARRAVTDLSPQPTHGINELRRAIAQTLDREDGIQVDPEREILVTNGGMHALHLIFAVLLDPGDEALIFSPGFFFHGVLRLVDAVPIYAETRQESGWQWNPSELEKAITPRTKLIILNSPANPTGYVATEDKLLAVAEIADRHNLLVVSDEAYDKMVYDNATHLRFASIPAARERTLTVCSFTKSYALQPWRMGFVFAPGELTTYLRNVLEWEVLSCNHVAQRAAEAALTGPDDWIMDIPRRYQKNRDLIVKGLRSAKGISFVIPQGTPFLFLNISGLGIPVVEFSRILLHNFGVPTEPGQHFGSNDHVRLMFGGTEEAIIAAANRISMASEELLRRV